ncbi:CHAT domain-containing protein [Archangium primigenium]|uniref:CHAT domain-containing protein n=1 Tax=[Archangium] primigenium TaxID=2792470 RepID=UPI0019580EBF|nr:CHAT domain-containing protein [Archangium primigenium]
MDWEALRARARELARRAGGPHGATPDALQALLRAEPAWHVDEALLQSLDSRLHELEPLPLLALCMHLLSGLSATPALADRYGPGLLLVAIQALYDLGRLEFFPLRLWLLDQMLALEPAERLRAELLFKRGNTRLALAMERPAQRDAALQDLEDSARLARACGATHGELMAECTLARAVFLQLADQREPPWETLGARISRLEALLHRTEEPALQADVYEILSELEVRGITLGREGATARALQYAARAAECSTSPLIRASRLSIQAHLWLLHGDEAQRAASEELARRAVATLPAEAGDIHAASPLATLGDVLRRRGQAAEAIGPLEQALRLMARQRPSSNRNLVRLHLVQALLDEERPKEALPHLETVFAEALALGDGPNLSDATQYLVNLLRDAGREADAQERLLKAEARLVGTPAQTRLTLIRLRGPHPGAPPSAEFIGFVRHYLSDQCPTDTESDALLQGALANQARVLPSDLRRLLLTSGQHILREPALRAQLLDAEGRKSDAADELRQALQHERRPGARLSAAAQLIALLPSDAHAERLRWCDEVETLLEGDADNPFTRTDLASALWMAGRRDKGLLERAWRHAERAARQLGNDARATVFNMRTQARIRIDQLSLQTREHEPTAVASAQWFTRDLPLPGKEVSGYRGHAVKSLLALGPLTPPDALTVADQLLALDPAPERSLELKARREWIRACLASPRSPPAPPHDTPEDLSGGFDALPGWAVALAHGEAPEQTGPLGAQERGIALAVLQARPDRAEAVLEWLFFRESDSRGFDTLADEVARASPTAMLHGLHEALEKVLAQKPTFHLLHLRVALRRRHASTGADAARAYTQAVEALLAHARTPKEKATAKLLRGIELLDAERHEDARPILEEGLAEARTAGLPAWERFPLLVSTGNAYRKGLAPDLARALALYTEAESLGSLSEATDAQLFKVKADALLDRGARGDAVQALALLTRALELRKTGYLRVETLFSAARAEQQQPGGTELLRLRRALDRLDEAEGLAEGDYRRMVAGLQTQVLAGLMRLEPQDSALQRRLERIGQRHPELTDMVQRALRGKQGLVSEEDAESISTLMSHPASEAFYEATGRLRPLDLDAVERMARQLGKDPAEARQSIEQDHQQQDRSPGALRALAERLANTEDAQARPGALLASAVLLAHLVAREHATSAEVTPRAHEAERLLRQLSDTTVRGQLLLELAQLWAPADQLHPVKDFPRAVELAREVRTGSPEQGSLARLALQQQARATRYRTDGDRDVHLREAESLYEQCAREYEAAGERDVALHVRMTLTELRLERGAGDPRVTLEEGIQAAKALLAEELSAEQKAKTWLTLAVYQTMLGGKHSDPAQARATYLAARASFERLDRSPLSASERDSADNYQTICLSGLAHREGRHEDAVQLWRQRLATLRADAPRDVRAYTVHNLADSLLRGDAPPIQRMEGLALSEQCLAVRTLEHNPVHHWETRENIGRGVASLLLGSPGMENLDVAFALALWRQGTDALSGAFAAARKLDSPVRLFRSAALLLELARVAPTLADLERTAQEAWEAMDEARPFLLLDEEAGAQEAHLAVELATTLARRLAEDGVVGASAGVDFVLSGARAEAVLRWVVRAVGSAQRRLAGRTARPEGAPHDLWVAWLEAIRSGEERRIQRALEGLRTRVPRFLRGEPDLEGTWAWLHAHPGAAALAVVQGARGVLAAVLVPGEPRQVMLAVLPVEAPPHDEAQVARGLSHLGPGPEYSAVLDWARRGVLAALTRLLPTSLAHLLWIPSGVLRTLAPADLWPAVPVTCAVRLDLETRAPPPRPRRTLLAVADPGENTPALALPHSVELMVLLARTAQETSDLRVRMSRGPRWGQALDGTCPGLVEGPASPDAILHDMAEVDVAVLLCHGEVDGPRDARLMLVDDTGAVAPLSMSRLAEQPQRVAGASIVLLSCETGRVGDWLHQAAGLAGALLAGGARSVIAPLWPVLLGPAWEVGRSVLAVLHQRGDPSEALRGIQAPEQGPALGRSAGGEQARQRDWSLKGFIHWRG